MGQQLLRSARRLFALSLIGLVTPAAFLSAQPLASYSSLVAQYRRGDVNGATAELASWGDRQNGEIEKSIRLLEPSRLRAAAMLHTDLAGAMVSRGERNRAAIQIRIATDVIDRMLSNERAEPTRTFVIRWYVLVCSLYLSEGSLTEAGHIISQGMRTFPGSAELWVARGTVAEMLVRINQGDERIQRGSTSNMATRTEAQITSAGLVFAHAIVLDPTSTVAHLHRGWLLHLLSDTRAGEEFRTALALAPDDRDRYLAHLFLGVTAEDNRDLETAAREYEAALALGGYQTACVALSRVEEARGQTTHAREVVSAYAHQPEHLEDPWWDFHVGGLNNDVLIWLRAEAVQR